VSESGFYRDNELTLNPVQLLVVVTLGLAERFLFLRDQEGKWVVAVSRFDAPLKAMQGWNSYGYYYWSPHVETFEEAVKWALDVNGGAK